MKGDAFERRELSSPLDTCSLDFYSEFIQLTRGPLKLLARTLHTAVDTIHGRTHASLMLLLRLRTKLPGW